MIAPAVAQSTLVPRQVLAMACAGGDVQYLVECAALWRGGAPQLDDPVCKNCPVLLTDVQDFDLVI